jgi:hypothetical protein
MSNVSRPVLLALTAVVAFAGVWFVALRPKPATTGSTPAAASQPHAPGVAGLKRAIDKAHGAVATSQRNARNQPGAAAPATTAPAPTGPATAAPTATAPTTAGPGRALPAGMHAHGPLARLDRALAAHQVVAILFYNPASPDDLAVKRALGKVDRHNGHVLVLTAPIGQLTRYTEVIGKVAVFSSPTVVIFDTAGTPGAVAGFADRTELDQRIDDALGGATVGHEATTTKSLSARDYHRRARSLADADRAALRHLTRPGAPDELGPALEAVERVTRNAVTSFRALTPPHRLMATQHALVALQGRFLGVLHRFQHRVTISNAPARTFLGGRRAVLASFHSLIGRMAPLERRLGLH